MAHLSRVIHARELPSAGEYAQRRTDVQWKVHGTDTPIPYRLVRDPIPPTPKRMRAPEQAPDSCRIIPVANGRFGVVRDHHPETGRRAQFICANEAEAQSVVAKLRSTAPKAGGA